jgi:hypothetical protein
MHVISSQYSSAVTLVLKWTLVWNLQIYSKAIDTFKEKHKANVICLYVKTSETLVHAENCRQLKHT